MMQGFQKYSDDMLVTVAILYSYMIISWWFDSKNISAVTNYLTGPNSCGGLLSDSSGTFHSVNFPKSNYPNSLTCVWHIRAPENHEVVLRFIKLTLEVSVNCKYDSITIFSGWSNRVETK